MIRRLVLPWVLVASGAMGGLALAAWRDSAFAVAVNPAVVHHWDWLDGAPSRWITEEKRRFELAHPGVKIERHALPDWKRYREVVMGALAAGTGVDVYYLPRHVSLGTLVAHGHAAPLPKTVWQQRFDERDLAVSSFKGEVYSFPIESPAARVRVLFAARGPLERSGVVAVGAPLRPLTNVGALIDAACKVSKALAQASPPAWGFGFGARPPSTAFSTWIDLAQANGGFYYIGGLDGFDPRTGRFEWSTNPAYIESIEALLALRDRGCLMPGAFSLSQEEGLLALAEGRIAFTFGTLRDLHALQRLGASLKGIDVLPLPRPAVHVCSWYETGAGRTFHRTPWSSRASVEWLSWLASDDARRRWAERTFGPVVGALGSPAGDAPTAFHQFLKLAPGETCPAPAPTDRNSAFAEVAIPATRPDAPELVEGALVGGVDLRAALVALDAAKESTLNEAIEAARRAGHDVRRSDLHWPNWTPGSPP